MKYKLSEVMNIIGGGTPKTKKPEYWNGTIPWLSVKDFANSQRYVYTTEKSITEIGLLNSSLNLLNKDDTIISARGTVGELAMIPFPMAFNQSCYGLRAKRGVIDPVFLYYLMIYQVETLKKNTHGSVFDTITRDTFSSIEVDIPSIGQQKRIAAILSSLDDKIENNRRINRHLEQMAQALFTQRIGEALDAKDSPDYCQIGDRLRLLNGFAFKSSLFSEAGQYKVVTIKNVQDGIVDASECSCVDDCPAAMPYHCRLAIGDVLLSLTGNVGRVGVVSEEKLLLNQRVAKLSPIDVVELPFWYFLFRHAKMKERLIALSRGTAQSNLSPIETMKLEIRYNRRKVLDYSQLTAPIFSMIVENLRANRSLAELRDSLLPRLMSGEMLVVRADVDK